MWLLNFSRQIGWWNLPPFCCQKLSKTRQVSPSCACWLRASACLWWWRHCRPWHQVSGCRWWPWAWSLRPSASGLKLVPCRMWTPRWWLGTEKADPLRLFHEGVLWKSIRLSIGDCWNGWLVDWLRCVWMLKSDWLVGWDDCEWSSRGEPQASEPVARISRRASTLELNRFDQGIHCLRGASFLEKSGNLPTNQPPNDEFHAKAALIYACEPIWELSSHTYGEVLGAFNHLVVFRKSKGKTSNIMWYWY